MVACFYKNGFGYQENILPAKHKELGFDVNIITYNKGGDASYQEAPAPVSYLNPDGIPVHVLKDNGSFLRKIPFVNMRVNATRGLYNKLEELSPDIIFMHGINMPDNIDVISYRKQHPKVKLYADNHSDYYNAPLKGFKKKFYRYVCGRTVGKLLGKYAEKVWGVTPWRVIYQQQVYGVPKEKSALLVMGGDENKIKWANRLDVRNSIREKLNIPEEAFVIITGGKIDKPKNIHLLVEAIKEINNPNIYLIIFGRYEADMINFCDSINSPNILNIGWIKAEDAYDYFLSSDFAAFPGTHSVLWEQACATGLPALFKDWDGGFNHIDVGGNCILLKEISVQNLMNIVNKVYTDKSFFNSLKNMAETKGRVEFSYIEIAKRSIGIK